MVEFKTEVPGTYILVDHSLGRLQRVRPDISMSKDRQIRGCSRASTRAAKTTAATDRRLCLRLALSGY
jgi:hypothetical protein